MSQDPPLPEPEPRFGITGGCICGRCPSCEERGLAPYHRADCPVSLDPASLHLHLHDLVAFEVPGLPAGKQRAKIVHRGGHASMAKREGTKEWYARVRLAAREAGVPLRDGPQALWVVAIWPCPNPYADRTVKRKGGRPAAWKPTKPDGKNVLAGVEDALEGIAYPNDSRLVDTRCTKLYAAQGQPGTTWVLLHVPPGPDQHLRQLLGLGWSRTEAADAE